MILTVTPNPSIDLLFSADTLVWDDANRLESPRRRAGGQGINLARAAKVLGAETVAVALLGGRTGAELQSLLEADGVHCDAVPIDADTRVFVAVREASGRSLLLNSRGPVLAREDGARLLAQVESACEAYAPEWMVCSGSIPRGLPADLYVQIARIARDRSIRFIADCDGEAFERAVGAGCDLLAPNEHEAARLIGKPVATVADAAAAARMLLARAPRVLIKLGEQGAVLAQSDGCWHAAGRKIAQGSAVGAGDAFLAAFLVADMRHGTAQQALSAAVAAGGAVLLSTGADLLRRDHYEKMLAAITVTTV